MDASRFQLVDSLYGPGTVGAWLLTVCSVFVSWTLDASSRRKDTLSINLFAALLLPLVSAGYLIFQIARLPASVVETITSQDVELQRYAAALEAPINVCDTFSMAALGLALCCGPWWNGHAKLKRLGMLLVGGLVSWGAENVMFAMATLKGVDVADATLSRPYLFLLTPIVATTWGFLALCCVIGPVIWLINRLNGTRAESQVPRTSKRPETSVQLRTLDDDVASSRVTREQIERLTLLLETAQQQEASDSVQMRIIAYITVFYIPAAAVGLLASTSSLSFSETKGGPELPRSRGFFIIPRSDVSMSSLDQILALIGGAFALLAALWHAHRARRGKPSPHQSVERRRSI